jgi:Predicted membrane protein (DUF2254)
VRRDFLLLARGVATMAGLMFAISASVLAIDLARAGAGWWQVPLGLEEARQLLHVFSRASNQLMAVMFTTVAIAVPLTANMYSVKVLDYFIRDRVNAAALTLVVFGNFDTTLLGYLLRPGFIPLAMIHFQLAIQVLSFALLFPYLYYVFRFLHPNTLLQRMSDDVEADLRAVTRHPEKAAASRAALAAALEHIGNIGIRSIDRLDRNTAIESVLVLERMARSYWKVKDRMPDTWFQAEPSLFLGLSSKAVEESVASRTWVETKLYLQHRQLMSVAIPKMHDVTSTIAKSLRRMGTDAAAQSDPALREMVVDYFNTFVRLALTRNDKRAVFTLFDQYRLFAEAIGARHLDLVRDIAYYFAYYGQVARDLGLLFITEAIAHDLGDLVQHAYASGAANASDLLQRFIAYDHAAVAPLRGVRKAQAILASFFLLRGDAAPAARLRASLEDIPREEIGRIRDELMLVTREKYWEVNERRMHLDWVPPAQREKLRELLDGLAPA